MKKIWLIVLWVFILPSYLLANTWPMSESLGSGWMEFDSGSIMAKNVSVEKHILLFRTSKKDVFKENADYTGYDFLKNKLGFTQDYVERNTIPDDYLDFQWSGSTIFIRKEQSYLASWSVDIAVRYYLKNNSNLTIPKQSIGFSFSKTDAINYHMLSEMGISDKNIYILNDENNYPDNFHVYEWTTELPINNDNFILQNMRGFERNNKQNFWYKSFSSINKTPLFELSFEPNETKVITITYSLPYKVPFTWTAYIDYNYSPIFNWEGGVVKNSYIAVIWDDVHIVNNSESYIDTNETRGYPHISIWKLWRNIYGIMLYNVSRNSSINNLKIAFSSLDDLIYRACIWMGCLSTNFLSWNEKDGQYYSENIEILPSSDPQKAIIKEIKNVTYDHIWNRKSFDYAGKEYEMDIFDMLK